jgi:hypothetical protein
MFKDVPEGKSSVGKPRKRWLDDIENNLKKRGVRGWRKIGKDRGNWNLILNEARDLHGTYTLWRRDRSVKGELESCSNKRSCFFLGYSSKD